MSPLSLNNNQSGMVPYDVQVKEMEKLQQRLASNQKLTQALTYADTFLNQQYLDFYSAGTVTAPDSYVCDPSKLRMFKISKMVYNPEEQINDKFISVFSSLHNMNSAVAIIVHSEPKNVYFYVATRADNEAEQAGETLRSVLRGNFPGIEISESFDGKQKRKILDLLASEHREAKSLASVSLIPSERDDDKDKFVQGMEKFFGAMNGKTYSAIFLATPVDAQTLNNRKRGFEELYSNLSPHGKITASHGQSVTDTVNTNTSESIADSINRSVSNTNGTSTANTHGQNFGTNDSFGFSGDGWNMGGGSSSGVSSAFTSGTNFSNTISDSTGKTNTYQTGSGEAHSVGDTDTITLNFENKSVCQMMEKTEAELKRIELSQAYGMWDFCAYFFGDDIAVTAQAANVYRALMMGKESSVEKPHVNLWNATKQGQINRIVDHIKYLTHPIATIPSLGEYKEQYVTPTNMVNGSELPIAMGFPRQSIPGVAVVEMAEFGRAVVYENPKRVKRTMEFGHIYHMGITEALSVPMDIDLLASHCFITGSSGSGKSYATYQLLNKLLQNDIKMLVIEPAKGEYKQVFGGLPGIRIFTTNPNVYKMLRINPFQFPENLHILTHIEKLIQIFNASWALYAAMPAILKDAVVQAYVACGWDVLNSVWIEGISDHKYPVFQDVLEILPKIINSSDYSSESKGNYKGALLTRVQSMTSGITGMIFERSEGIPDSVLFDSNAVVDLSEIGSEETIALLMGVLIMRLGEYHRSVREAGSGEEHDEPLKHVTVLEEAHNILKRTSKDQSQEGANIVGQSVQMISNSIKEMRTYGEGFIIIDQSPMAVDTSAIENTSTKIIMNTPAKDACEELSSALSLNEEQSRELARLTTGVAATFQKGWLTPVLMKVDQWVNPYEVKAKRADMDAIRQLRGDMIIELYRQVQTQKYSVREMKNIIKVSAIDVEKKRDMLEYVMKMNDMLQAGNQYLEPEQVADLYISIANINGLFTVLDDKGIPSCNYIAKKDTETPKWGEKHHKSIKEKSRRWIQRFEKSLPLYVTITEKQVISNLLDLILIRKAGDDPYSNKYGTILMEYKDLL